MVQNTQTIPTNEESLLIYLADRILSTRGNIIGITNSISRIQKDMVETQSREARLEWNTLLEDKRKELSNYMFRLDFLQKQLEEFKNNL